MSKQEIKEQINRLLDQLPQEALEELLEVVKKKYSNEEPAISSELLNKILQEDKTLLTKLAQ